MTDRQGMMNSKHFGTIQLALAGILAVALPGRAQNCARAQSANSRVFAPGSQPTLVVKNKEVTATSQAGQGSIQLAIDSTKSTIGTTLVRLPQELVQVDEICLLEDRIVIRGLVSSSLAEVAILNIGGVLIDSFRAYWPNISDSSGLIIFTKEYPAHFAYGTEDHYLLYMLDSPVERNHSPVGAEIRSRPAGIPLYPLSAGNQNYDNFNLQGAVHEQAANGFFWDAEGSEAVTLDSFQGKFKLVLIQIGRNGGAIRSLEINPRSVCEPTSGAVCPSMLYLWHAAFSTDKSGNKFVVATFGRPQDQRFFEKTFPVSSFPLEGNRSLENPQWHP